MESKENSGKIEDQKVNGDQMNAKGINIYIIILFLQLSKLIIIKIFKNQKGSYKKKVKKRQLLTKSSFNS